MTGHLREGDADLLLEVLGDAHADEPGIAVPWALLEGLQRLVPCDLEVSYQHHDFLHRRSPMIQAVLADGTRAVEAHGEENADDPFWQLWWSSSCSWPQRTGDLRTVLLSTDLFPTERDRRNDPMLRDVLPDITSEVLLSLPAAPGEARRFCFFRASGPAFDERDRAVLRLLRPHLQELLLEAERRRAGVPTLTPREWEVLGLAASGLSTAEIAAALWLSPGTVRKHAEHIRERLGVHTMAAAAAKALPHAPGVSRPAPPAAPPAGWSGSARSPGAAAGR